MAVELETKELSDAYYLDNFKRLLDFVFERYDDLLKHEETDFYKSFNHLSEGAQRLYVRLISRKGPYFRLSKLKYPEIMDIKAAAEELVEDGFLFLNPREGIEFGIDVWLIDELKSFGKDIGLDKSELVGGKASVQNTLLQHDESELWRLFESEDHLIVPGHYNLMSIYMLLFFGNNYQTLSDFILEDIGVLRYEPYEIHDESRCFESRKELDQLILINQLRQNYWYGYEMGDIDWLKQVKSILDEQELAEIHQRKGDKLYNDIGAFMEKAGLLEDAVASYSKSNSHPANERMIRILDKQKLHSQAIDACETLIDHSNNYDELIFAKFFIEGQKRKLGLDYIKQKRLTHVSENIILNREEGLSIEAQLVNHYQNQGIDNFYTENTLWKVLFGLAFWDIIFEPLKGVFYNPFQREPNDFRTTDFRLKRSDLIDQRLKQIQSGEYKAQILETYRIKNLTANTMVSWKQTDIDQIQAVLDVVPSSHLHAILDRMVYNPGEFSSGFPDIFSFTETGYQLIEVKGPGDQLRNNQRAWLKYFKEKDIPYKVVGVKWAS